VSASSDTSEILRYVWGFGVGYEVLDHSSMASIDLSRFQGENGGPVLYNHNRDTIIGRFTPTSVTGGVLRGVIRFAKNPDGERAFQDVQDEILCDTSIGYDYDEGDVVQEGPAGGADYPTYRIKNWTLNELSLVTVPADPSVGVGRNHQPHPASPAVTTRKEGHMTPEELEAARQASEREAARKAAETIKNMGDARAQERAAVIQLRALAERFGIGPETDAFLATDKTVDEVRNQVFALLQERGPKPIPAPAVGSSEDLGLTDREQARFSIGRAIRALITRDLSGAGFEQEVSNAMAKRLGRSTSGFFVPNDFKTRVTSGNVLQTKVSAQGGASVYTEYAGWIDLLRNRTRVFQMGAQLFSGLRSNYSFVRQNAAASVYWISENPGVDVTDTTIGIQNVTMTPKILKGMLSFTAEQLAQAAEMFDALCNTELLRVHSIELDRVALNGSGTGGQPTGILNQSGIGAVALGTNGMNLSTLGVAPFVDLETAVATANADLGSLGYLTTAGIRGECKKYQEFPAQPGSGRVWQNNDQKDGSGTVNGYYAAASNNVPSNLTKGTSSGICHASIFANWSDLFVGEWGGGLELLVDPFTLAGQDITRVISRQLVDVALGHPGSFAAIKDLL
jgi:HK97 family phage major capsid protein